MKKTRKTIIAISLLSVLPMMLASCGSSQNVDNDVYEEFDPNKQYELDFLGWGSLGEQSNFNTMIGNFMKKYPNVKVFYQAISDTTQYSANLVNNANSLPDVFYVPDWDYIKWTDAGKLLNYKQYLSQDEIDKMWAKSIDIFRWDKNTKTVGRGEDIYGLPKDLGPYAIVYNKDLILELNEKYNLGVELPSASEPMSWAEFEEYLGKFKGLRTDETNIIPLTHYELSCAVYSNNANYYKDDSATESDITNQNFIDAVQWVADLSTSGLAADYASAGTSSSFTKFATQQSLFTFMGPWDMVDYWDGLSFEFDIMPVPYGPAEGAKSTSLIGTVAYSVSAASKNKAAAVLLAKYLACGEEAAKANYLLGQAMPNIKSMAENDWINNVGLEGIKQYPMSKSVFVDVVRGTEKIDGKSRPYYYTYEKTAFDDLMDQFNPVWAGTKTASDVINAYAKTFQDKLTKMHKNLE